MPLPEIVIPDMADGAPVVAESSARFARNDQQLPLSFPDDEQVTVTAKPHERLNVEVYLSLEQFRVPYTVYASVLPDGSAPSPAHCTVRCRTTI